MRDFRECVEELKAVASEWAESHPDEMEKIFGAKPRKNGKKTKAAGACMAKNGTDRNYVSSDEYYTKYSTIDFIIRLYDPAVFENKFVYCNCDSNKSNIYIWFKDNFERLKLRRLVATGISYDPESVLGMYYEYDGIEERSRRMEWTGSFNSYESLRILGECDMCITNPPFSMITEYMRTVIDSGKMFITFMGNMNICNSYILDQYIKEKFYVIMTSHVGFRIIGPNWFDTSTGKVINSILVGNIPGSKELEKSIAMKFEGVHYDSKIHKKYDNYDAVNCDSRNKIPNIEGLIGVPVTIINSKPYDRDEIELVGCLKDTYIDGKPRFNRIIIRLRHPRKN